MTNESPSALHDEHFMDALLDVVLPPSTSRRLPGAGSLGLSSAVAAGLRGDPMLGPMVTPGVEALRVAALLEHPDGLAGMTPEAAKNLLETHVAANPVLMLGLLRYLYPAYYEHPSVLAGIGEPPRPPFPEGFQVEATDPQLLAKLEARSKTQ